MAVDVFAVDTVFPTVAVIAPVQDAILTTAFPEVRWAGEDETSGILGFQIRLDDRTPIVAGAVDNFTFPNLGDGRHVPVVTARDLAGNAASASVEFTVDTNIFSPTGPFGIFLLLNVVVAAIIGAALVLYLLYRRRRRPPS